MKKDEIPQQAHEIYEGEKKVVYAVNESGKLEMSQTAGWDVEVKVLQEAIDDINRQAQEALERVNAGVSSPLEYHMYAQRMDLPMLAQNMGYFQWRVRRHFKPKHFSKLKKSQLALYASVLDIDENMLTKIHND